eukprot:Em0491g2a
MRPSVTMKSPSEMIPFHDLCALMEKIHKTQGTDKKKKILSSFIERWRETHARLHASHRRGHDGSYHGADVDGDWTHSKVPSTDTFFAIMRLLLPELDQARPAYGMKETALFSFLLMFI